MSTREDIYCALLAKLKTLGPTNSGGNGTFVTVTDEVMEVQRFTPQQQPVIELYEMDEDYGQNAAPMQKRTMDCWLIIGCTTKKGKPGARTLNPLIDAVETLIKPPTGFPFQTLDNRVQSVRIKKVEKMIGDFSTDPDRQHAANIQIEIISSI